jgi:hypothetical protein
MQNVRVINPLRHFLQQPVVPDIVKVGSQVKVEDARLLMDNCLCYPLDRVMRCPLGPISKRSRLEIRFENRLEDELERLWLPKIVSGLAQMPRWVILASGCLTS